MQKRKGSYDRKEAILNKLLCDPLAYSKKKKIAPVSYVANLMLTSRSNKDQIKEIKEILESRISNQRYPYNAIKKRL